MTRDLKFTPFKSAVSITFWHKFAELKLNTIKLNEEPIRINCQIFRSQSHISIEDGKTDYVFLPGISISEESLIEGGSQNQLQCITGTFLNKNTADSFKSMDKAEHINEFGKEIWEFITSKNSIVEPEKMLKITIIAYSDLKKYHFYHWMAFPVPMYPFATLLNVQTLEHTQIESISSQLQLLKVDFYFFVEYSEKDFTVHKLFDLPSIIDSGKDIIVGVVDFSSVENTPTWLTRPLLALIAYHFPQLCSNLKLLCWRNFANENKSIVLTLDVSTERPQGTPKFVGWEKNSRGKYGPNFTNLSTTMDPIRLADSAVSLNLKLMKWRVIPSLNLELLERTKCLLLGAGTLGCSVARALQAWGFKNIVFVDSGKVSYSNPVRQSLFKFKDCEEQKFKALAAADAMKEIFPGTESKGVVLEIPMPGHALSPETENEVKEVVKTLESLIDETDVVFLLLDSREARWLPTLLGAAKKKMVMNAALGFDSYLVMRHGWKKIAQPQITPVLTKGIIPGHRLGCYFCNDVMAPGDSLRGRTLDQQCTVTRPGVSMMAAALVVEILVSALQHSESFDAPSSISSDVSDIEGPLGLVPHSIRGDIYSHNIVLPATEAFNKCSTCSDIVVETYNREGFEFLKRIFDNPVELEKLTGLDKLQDVSGLIEVLELSDED
ncbi:ubiquitin-like modifier-activating enzyme ATG7 isoform X3 [Artemia franciscana]|uniref:ubiquitin-like modifier-activating enzyme ATG7 isoform X3 n=1 Tax=Artemia franciscana TaxID=6661 RepID=UPI0032DB851E